MYVIYRKHIIDGVLATSALRGDITGRGHMLVDNDEYALKEIVNNIVPAALEALALEYQTTSRGWRIFSDRYKKYQLRQYLIDCVMRHLTDKPQPGPESVLATLGGGAAGSVSLEGYFA